MSTATKSKDGALRFTFIVKHRADLRDLVDGVLYRVTCYGEAIPNSRAKWLDVVRCAFKQRGQDLWAATEEAPAETRAELTLRCLVLFPELRPTDFRQYGAITEGKP
jgi:hypothetical protein